MTRQLLSTALASVAIGLSGTAASAATVTITVDDNVPNGAGGSGTNVLSSSQGSASSSLTLPTLTYTVTGLDLTSVGGGASETIAYDILFTQNGGTGVQFNGFGNISVTGGANNNQIEGVEDITATVSVNAGLTTFTGGVSVGFIQAFMGGASGTDTWNITHAGGTIARDGSSAANNFANFDPSSFFTADPTAGDINIQRYVVQIDAVPEPGSFALLSLGGLCMIRRRRR